MSYCTADKPMDSPYYGSAPGWWGMFHRQPSYSINHWLSRGKGISGIIPAQPNYPASDATGPAELVYVRTAQVPQASHKVLLCETHYSGVLGASWEFVDTDPSFAWWGNYPMVPITISPWAPTGAISYPRHPDGFNTSFADGHVQFIYIQSPVTYGPWYNPQTSEDFATYYSSWLP